MVLKSAKYQPPSPRSLYSLSERVVSAAVYIPFMIGFVIGIVYIVAKGEGCDRNFFRFHFYQSIFLSIALFCVDMVADGMSGVVIGTLRLFEGLIGTQLVSFLSSNLLLTRMILMSPLVLLTPYAIIFALMGKYANIPLVSGVINKNMLGR
jgi:uncharacterized membrane protein